MHIYNAKCNELPSPHETDLMSTTKIKPAKTLLPRLTLAATATLLFTGQAIAAGSDFANTDFAAAAPFTYNHATGGGAYNDRTTGAYNDITEQLEGAEFTCGDIVTYLANIQIEESTIDPVQTAEFDFRFLGNSTGQRGVAQIAIVNVAMNYGEVENGDNGNGNNPGAGSYGMDSGISDDGGSTASLISETFMGTPFQSGGKLLGTVQVDDLEPGESTVLRIDVLLACDPGTSPTGNLQGLLDDGRVVYTDGSTDAISTGKQTIPFKKVGEIAGAGEPLLKIEKNVTIAEGTCGVDDARSLSAYTQETVKYCYRVSNPGTADLLDVQLIDDNGTPGDTSDDFEVVLTGLADLDGEADRGDLGGTQKITGEALVELPGTEGKMVTTAAASGNNGLSGGNYKELTDTDTATVQVSFVPNNPPVVEDDNYTTTEDTPLTVSSPGVLANDSDLDQDYLSVTVKSEPGNGTLMQYADGSFEYTPSVSFTGTDSYTYEACDPSGACDTATVTVTVTAAAGDVLPTEAPIVYTLSEFVGSASEAWGGSYPSDVSGGNHDTRSGSIEINTIGERTRFSEEKFVAGVVNLRNGTGAIVEQKQLERKWPSSLNANGCNPTTAFPQCWYWKDGRTINAKDTGTPADLPPALNDDNEVALMVPEKAGSSSDGFDSISPRVTVSGGLVSNYDRFTGEDNNHQTMIVTWEVPAGRSLSETERRFHGHYDWECDGLEGGQNSDDPWVELFYRSSNDSGDDIHNASVTVIEDTATRLTIEVNIQAALQAVRDSYAAEGKDIVNGCQG
jgi:hypothetical protein